MNSWEFLEARFNSFSPISSAAGGHQALSATHHPRPPPQGHVQEGYYTRVETPMPRDNFNTTEKGALTPPTKMNISPPGQILNKITRESREPTSKNLKSTLRFVYI